MNPDPSPGSEAARDRIVACYLDLARSVDRATDRLRERHRTSVNCRAGCNLCCRDFIQCSILEASVVRAGFLCLPPQMQRRIDQRGRALDERLTACGLAEPGPYYPADDDAAFGRAFRALQALPEAEAICPLNEGGLCSIYEHRPMACRTFGYPVDGYFGGCPGGNFEGMENVRLASLCGDRIDSEMEALARRFTAGTALEGMITDTRYAGVTDWEELTCSTVSSSTSTT